MIHNLETIEQEAEKKQSENDDLIPFLKNYSSVKLNSLVQEINKTVEPQIDCTRCGNCCKTLMINVEDDEAKIAADALKITKEDFEKKYLEKGTYGMAIINTIPCHFLNDNKCSIYNSRFAGCKEFPGLHLPNIEKRLFTVMMHYSRCPIIFNVIEELKIRTGFSSNLNQIHS